MKTIPKEYFDPKFDATLYILEVCAATLFGQLLCLSKLLCLRRAETFLAQNLPATLDAETMEKAITDKERAMDLVDSRLSAVIMDNYKSFGLSLFARYYNYTYVLCATKSDRNAARPGIWH